MERGNRKSGLWYWPASFVLSACVSGVHGPHIPGRWAGGSGFQEVTEAPPPQVAGGDGRSVGAGKNQRNHSVAPGDPASVYKHPIFPPRARLSPPILLSSFVSQSTIQPQLNLLHALFSQLYLQQDILSLQP
ncbi:hypothetical protein B0T13DRAFT_277297 [Neurospora crassa]|nr:hypothetical protein B0T13DRAFT_277297 [Neurospora crassa]